MIPLAFDAGTAETRGNLLAPLAKRTLDLTLAVVGLIVLCPVMLMIALAVVIDSRGPVLFRQVRVGRFGRPFAIYKFRTMVADAAQLGANISPSDDPRITRVGRFLRRRYLDELPQLLNILRGDMALVGPRPETPEFVALYEREQLKVLTVRPGVLGPSTLAGMEEEDRLAAAADPLGLYVSSILPERVSADIGYVERWSIGGDLRLLAAQLWAIARKM